MFKVWRKSKGVEESFPWKSHFPKLSTYSFCVNNIKVLKEGSLGQVIK